MTARTRLILAIVGVLVVCVAFYFVFVRARQNELKTVNQEIADENSRTVQLQSELARLQDLQDRAPELQAELAEIREQVPQNHETASFIFEVEEAADAAGVEFVQITPELPKAPPEGAPLAEVRIVVGGDGGYFALQDFVRRLYNLDRAVRIDLLTMAGVEDQETRDTTIDMDLTLRIFHELPAATGTATAGGTTAAPAPGTTPAPAPAPATTP